MIENTVAHRRDVTPAEAARAIARRTGVPATRIEAARGSAKGSTHTDYVAHNRARLKELELRATNERDPDKRLTLEGVVDGLRSNLQGMVDNEFDRITAQRATSLPIETRAKSTSTPPTPPLSLLSRANRYAGWGN
jgi:hypothetical protein